MSKFYNNFSNISTTLIAFFSSLSLNLSKPNVKNLAFTISSIIDSESIITSSIANSFSFSSAKFDSLQKRIWRFFNNNHVDIYHIFNSTVNHIISNISNVRHNELIVTIDHMFIKDNFVILMFTLRIGTQGIPIYFSLERTSSNCHNTIQKNARKNVFSTKFICDAIDYVVSLLNPLNSKIIFLCDRWFFNLSVLNHIASRNCFFAVRAKVNSSVKVLLYDNKEKHSIWHNLSDFKPYAYKPNFFYDLYFGDMRFKANLSIAPYKRNPNIHDDEDTWFIITNLDPKLAIRKYKKRFAAIEMLFKSQKTNGFYLEKTKTKNLHAMETLYGVACIAHIWLSILGLDYIKNYNHVKKIIDIRFNKKSKSGKLIRILSSFRLGLILFHRVIKSQLNYNIKCNFKLYL